MKQIVIATVFAMVFGLAAFAQTAPVTPQSSPNPSTQPQTAPSTSPDTSVSGSQTPVGETKGESTLKGCIASESGKYLLQDESGKKVVLGGSQDFATHVGHTVAAHGVYAAGSDPSTGASATSPSTAAPASGDQFIVSKVDMVSETCTIDKGKNSK